MSPFLFVLMMEVFSGMMRAKTTFPEFKFHWRCSRLNLSHLCFADDLMIFSHGSVASVRLVKETLSEFSALSGLSVNPLKSAIFCCGMDESVVNEILQLTGFTKDSLPVRYLGVPLISSRLSAADCSMLVYRFSARLNHWSSRSLSYAGRLQLISSVLFSLQNYWASLFILPSRIYKTLEQIMSRFLWSGSAMESHKSRVAWHDLTRPKREGGLGLRRITDWNKAAILKHV